MRSLPPGQTRTHREGWAVWPSLIIDSAHLDPIEMAMHNAGPIRPWSVLRWMEAVQAAPKLHMPAGWVASSGFYQGGIAYLRLQSPETYVQTELWLGGKTTAPSLWDVCRHREIYAHPTEDGQWVVDSEGEPFDAQELGGLAHRAKESQFSRSTSTHDEILYVLGSRDTEMDTIADLLRARGRRFIWGQINGQRVAPGQDVSMPLPTDRRYMGVECAVNGTAAVFDHHGDRPEASWPPERAWDASSLGQVWNHLDGHNGPPKPDEARRVVPQRYLTIAALDHCLAAACRGIVPGVSSGQAKSQALKGTRETFAPNMPILEFDEAIELARESLMAAKPALDLSPEGHVADLRHLEIDGPVAEATGEQYPSKFQFGPAIGSIFGRGYVVRIRRKDGRIAIRMGGCGEGTIPGSAPINRWLDGVWEDFGCLPFSAPRPNGVYGNATRGFAGGTLR